MPEIYSTTPILFDVLEYITGTVGANWPLISIVIGGLKWIAVKTGDPRANRIADLVSRVFGFIRSGGLLRALRKTKQPTETVPAPENSPGTEPEKPGAEWVGDSGNNLSLKPR